MKNILLLITILTTIKSFGQNEILVKELNPALFNQDFHLYNQNTALFCGQLSEIVYWNEDRIEKFHKTIASTYPKYNSQFKFIDNKKSNSQALLWCNAEFLVIAFRGTEPSKLKDIFTDSKFWNYSNNPSQNDNLSNMPVGHGGFRKSLINLITENNLFEEINTIIKTTNPNVDIENFPIFLTGHSLGAAISQLFIECLNYKKYTFSGAYHFAPPLAVACIENDKMKANYGDKVYDIVNYKDYIPRAGRNDVAHFGQFYRICNDGFLYKEPEAYVRFNNIEYLKVIKYHKLNNHLQAIRNKENSIDKIESRSIGNSRFPCMEDRITEESPCK